MACGPIDGGPPYFGPNCCPPVPSCRPWGSFGARIMLTGIQLGLFTGFKSQPPPSDEVRYYRRVEFIDPPGDPPSLTINEWTQIIPANGPGFPFAKCGPLPKTIYEEEYPYDDPAHVVLSLPRSIADELILAPAAVNGADLEHEITPLAHPSDTRTFLACFNGDGSVSVKAVSDYNSCHCGAGSPPGPGRSIIPGCISPRVWFAGGPDPFPFATAARGAIFVHGDYCIQTYEFNTSNLISSVGGSAPPLNLNPDGSLNGWPQPLTRIDLPVPALGTEVVVIPVPCS